MKSHGLTLFLGFSLVAWPALAAETLTVTKASAAPAVDGTADALWEAVPATVVEVAPIPANLVAVNKEKQGGKYAPNWAKEKYTGVTEVELKAVRTDAEIFFLARWKDPTKDDQHKPFKWEGDPKTGEYGTGKEREDRIAFRFPIRGKFTANMLSDVDSVVDVWQWKAARTNGAGLAHDKTHVYSRTEPKGTFSTHYTAAGTPIHVSRPGDGGVSPYKSNKVDPFTHQGASVPQYIAIVPEVADASDVKAKGVWTDGYWTVEIGRKLDTGNPDTDTVFDPAKGTKTSVAVFDHVGDHFHAVSGVIEIAFAP